MPDHIHFIIIINPEYNKNKWQFNKKYDHIIRNNESLEKIRAYINANPSKWNPNDH